MNKTWFSYVVLSVGLMLSVTSDDKATADDKEFSHSIDFNSQQKIEVLVNRDGESDAKVEVIIDGKKHSFTLPEIEDDGTDHFITTDDGTEIKVKSISGNKVIWIDGNEMNLPVLGRHRVPPEGLSAMISRTHQIKISDEISISAPGVSADVKAAIVSAIEAVLTSYDIKKKVSVKDNDFDIQFLSKDSLHGKDGMIKFEFKTDDEDIDAEKIIFIESKSSSDSGNIIHIKTDDDDQ